MQVGLFFTLYAISLPVFLALDLLWLGVIAKGFYRAELGPLLGNTVWPAAILFYAVFIFGLTYFVTYPSVLRPSILIAIGSGALFGFIAYATYDLTNWATLKGWSPALTLVDILWGSVLGGLVSGTTLFIYKLFS
jgi:uncharacterized membrane protein